MAIMTVVGIVLGLICAAVDLYAATADNKTRLHRMAHLTFAFVFYVAGLSSLDDEIRAKRHN